MAKPELGSKRQCLSCASKFYDLNKDPIICPKCGAVFQVTAVKARPEPVAAPRAVPSRSRPKPSPSSRTPKSCRWRMSRRRRTPRISPGDDDVEIEESEADDTFLVPEEESEDDVTGLIDKGEDDEET